MSVAAATPPHLAVRTVPLRDGRDLLDHLPAGAPLAWSHRGDGLVAWGEAARFDWPGEDSGLGAERFTAAAAWLAEAAAKTDVRDGVGLPGTGLVAFGGFTFDGRSAGSSLVIPRVIVGRRADRAWLTTVCDRPGTHPGEILDACTPARPIGPLAWTEGSIPAAAWGEAVTTAVRRIRAGELSKVVLARDVRARAEQDIDIRTLLRRLTRDYPGCYTFSIDGMVGATPELLVRREGGRIGSLVLAGTRARGATPQEDQRLAAELTTSAKDLEEHEYAIESLRAALAPLAEAVETPDRPRLLRLANVQHLASPARAELRPGVSTLDVVAALHPTAAVGGTPTGPAMELIRDLEAMDRGRYAGPVGWIDARGNGEWGIALRCAHISGARARLFAGCGIVAGSTAGAELAEADSKFQVMRQALVD
ncbi:menaquinone-specific isochorismate synthase [Nocardiopsis mwathae]|uniref:isochorismate synthase n=1 Tax=Nocardiopsis mwathae TaxID=1472723 RepID=A0A7W9YG51_9ACTN|nr:menaquinone-specific isochorismate synthase [Nocardiopsis mwathae]